MTTPRPGTAGRASRLLARWWVFTARPMSLRAAWRLSGAVDARRVPAGSPIATALWWWSNRTDRLLLFALAILAPTVLTGPLLHGPTWWPLVPAVFVTPALTFLFNRQWVFG